jgi:L-seryl-tRNA(Ser) seleniumtransferase
MDPVRQQALRALPAVEELLGDPGAAPLLERYSRPQVVEAVRTALSEARQGILGAGSPGSLPPADADGAAGEIGTASIGPISPVALLARAATVLATWDRPGLRQVLNLSGVVVHTNLGRSRLAESAVERVVEVARSYSDLEYDLEEGTRGNRETHYRGASHPADRGGSRLRGQQQRRSRVAPVDGAGRGSRSPRLRGQLVEIGGSFRLPDVMRAGGVRLVEVGTTNRTRIADYEAALTPETAMLLRVHTSNYRIMGFTEETELAEMVELGQSRGVVVADDLGSGALHDLEAFRGEPSVAASLRTGADVVCFSGDKLLGGPQAGILVGRKTAVDRLRKHPVARALRLDKMTLAALEATLRLYQDPARAHREIPTLRYLSRPAAVSSALAVTLQSTIERVCEQGPAGAYAGGLVMEVEQTAARAGGGSMPLIELPSHAVRIRFPEAPVEAPAPGGSARPAGAAGGPGGSIEVDLEPFAVAALTVTALEAALRQAPVPVVARVSQDSLHLDVLALDEAEIETVAASVAWAVGKLMGGAASAGPRGAASG